MDSKRPYTHILKNLFHEQATEIIPLFLPGFEIKQTLSIEQPDLKLTYIEAPSAKKDVATQIGQGFAELALPGAEIQGVYESEYIEHSGQFERAYRFQNPETPKPSFLLAEIQIEHDDKKLSRYLLLHYIQVSCYAGEDVGEVVENDVEDEDEDPVKRKIRKQAYFIYPYILCRFPQEVPACIVDKFGDQIIQEFNFRNICLWEKDAREYLNTHVSAIYYLLPAMKNADAALLGLAIKELAQRFQNDEQELGRHLTGLNFILQESETMSEEEKLATQEHLKPFIHLIKNDPEEGQ